MRDTQIAEDLSRALPEVVLFKTSVCLNAVQCAAIMTALAVAVLLHSAAAAKGHTPTALPMYDEQETNYVVVSSTGSDCTLL